MAIGIVIALTLFAYLIGGIPFGVIICKGIFGTDPREMGSKNIGATNCFRAAGPIGGMIVLFLDAAKGAVPTFLFVTHEFSPLEPHYRHLLASIYGLAAILGHVFPVYLSFKGGKGVATAAGVLLVLEPSGLVFSFGVFALFLMFLRYVSLASMMAAVSFPLYVFFFQAKIFESTWTPVLITRYLPILILGILLALLVVIRHVPNLKRIKAGTEPKFGDKPKTTGEKAPAP